MHTTATFTSTISSNLLSWLKEYSSKAKTTKRAIIEEALKKYRTELRRKELKDSFIRASKDKDMELMAEEGLDDFLEQIDSLQKI